jgi:hypothetical protein
VGRLPTVVGGGPAAPEMAQAGKATDPKIGIAGLPKRNECTGLSWLIQNGNPVFIFLHKEKVRGPSKGVMSL